MVTHVGTPLRVLILRYLFGECLGIVVAIALWVTCRPFFLGLPPNFILYPSQEALDQRLFTYTVFGVGAIVAGLLVTQWRMAASSIVATVGYFGVAVATQGLLSNPDYWKLIERGYAVRGLEMTCFGLILGALIALGHRAAHRK